MNFETVMNKHDFHLVQTGGGCTAWEHTLENGDQVLITEPDEPNATTAADQPCTVTLLADHELAKQWGCDNADDALHAAKFYVSEYYHTS